MRILYLTTSYPPYVSGPARFVYRLSRAMQERGATVAVISPRLPAARVKGRTRSEQKLVRALKTSDPEVIVEALAASVSDSVKSFERLIHEQIQLPRKVSYRKQEGVQEYFLPSLSNPFRRHHAVFWVDWLTTKSVIERFRPTVIHCNDPALWIPWLAPWAKKKGIKIVVTQHAYIRYVWQYVPWLRWTEPAVIQLWRWILSYFPLVTTPSKSLATEVREVIRVPKSTQVRVVSNGYRPDWFHLPAAGDKRASIQEFSLKSGLKSPKYSRERLSRPIRFVYAGRLDVDKSLPLLIEAFAIWLRQQITPALGELWLIGAGSDEQLLKQQAADLGIAERVHFWGQQPESALAQYFWQADVFVLPSTIETQSITALQAYACGLSVIGADTGAIPELVVPNKTGWLFAPGSVLSLVRCMTEAAQHPKLRQTYGLAGHRWVQKHTAAQVDEQWWQLYQDTV